MSPIDLAPPAILAPAPKLWTPAKPFIIRASEDDHAAVKAMPFLAAIAGGARRAAGAVPIVLTPINGAVSGSDLTTYDFGNFTAASDGLMIVGVAGRSGSSRTLSSVSIGGTNGTINVSTASAQNVAGIASRVVSAGSQNVQATLSGSMVRAGCYVWLLTGYTSATPHASNAPGSGTGTSSTATFDIPANGVAVYFGLVNATPSSWTSATQRYATQTETSQEWVTAADKATVAALTAHAETVSWSGSGQRSFAGASWG